MRWTPGGAVGVIALCNVTYGPMTELAARIHDLVVTQGAVPSDARPLGDRLKESADALLRVLGAWSEGAPVKCDELARVFDDNVAADEPFDRRALRAFEFGALTPTRMRATSDAAAEITCTTAAGRMATITFTLSPRLPARIQTYAVRPDAGATADQ